MTKCITAFKLAFPKTIPIMAGFVFLGISYGFLMTDAGYSMIYPVSTSAGVFAGSLEFLFVELLNAPFNPWLILFLTLMINARHIFYGISMLDKFKDTGWKKYFLIFGMCDETFSINCDLKLPKHVDNAWYMLHITWLNYIYWVGGVVLGCILSHFINVDIKGLDFVLTSLFLVIVVEQWLTQKNHTPALVGIISSVVMLIIFKFVSPTVDYFALPAMILMLIVFYIIYKKKGIKND